MIIPPYQRPYRLGPHRWWLCWRDWKKLRVFCANRYSGLWYGEIGPLRFNYYGRRKKR